MIEDLSSQLTVAKKQWASLWRSFRRVAEVLRTLADEGQSWAQFIPNILARL
jgi:hypothetical protein